MRRRRHLIVLTALLAAVATFFLPPVYWRAVGWLKGGAFYQGRPTSWWERDIHTSYFPTTSIIFVPQNDNSVQIVEGQNGWERKASSSWHEWIEILRLTPATEKPPLTDGDAKARVVLEELLSSDDAKVRSVAAWGLDRLPSTGKDD